MYKNITVVSLEIAEYFFNLEKLVWVSKKEEEQGRIICWRYNNTSKVLENLKESINQT